MNGTRYSPDSDRELLPDLSSKRPDDWMEMSQGVPRVGVGVIIVRQGLVLLGQRRGSHGAGSWALPGGHLEFGEAVDECAVREVREETGLEVRDVSRGPYSSDIFEGKHYVTLFVVAHIATGEPRLLEPEKCSQWQWFRWSELPNPLFQPLASLHKTGYVPPGLDKSERPPN
jgi:8-oxo-dGTP diphosphatase